MIKITLPSPEHLEFVKAALKMVQVPFPHARTAVEVAEALDKPEAVMNAALEGYTDR